MYNIPVFFRVVKTEAKVAQGHTEMNGNKKESKSQGVRRLRYAKDIVQVFTT